MVQISSDDDSSPENGGNTGIIEEMKGFVNDFVTLHKPEEVILVGANTQEALFSQAISSSRVADLVALNPNNIRPEHVVALGAAKLARDWLESQVDDCVEDEVYQKVRRRADNMAGDPRGILLSGGGERTAYWESGGKAEL